MKAVVLRAPFDLSVEDVPDPIIKTGEVLVKVHACGICGSDLRYLAGENPWSQHTVGENIKSPPNMILGHEFTGEVVKAADKKYEYMVGKRVGVLVYNTCGVCEYCRSGRENLCRDTQHIGHGAGWGEMKFYPGGMAEYCQVWATHCYEIPDSLSYEEATTLDFLAVATHAVKLSGISPGKNIAVIGSGPVGLAIAQISKVFGAYMVYCFDKYESALQIAEKCGINEVFNVNKGDITNHIMQNTQGKGVYAAFDTVGTTGTQRNGLSILSPGGILVNLVANSNEAKYSLTDISAERRIISSSNNPFTDFQFALEMLSYGKINVKPMITHRFDINRANEAFDILQRKEESGAFKVIININQ